MEDFALQMINKGFMCFLTDYSLKKIYACVYEWTVLMYWCTKNMNYHSWVHVVKYLSIYLDFICVSLFFLCWGWVFYLHMDHKFDL